LRDERVGSNPLEGACAKRERGSGEVADIAEQRGVRRASMRDATGTRALRPLSDISVAQWRKLAGRAIEPNGYYQPDWELAVNASARGRTGVRALHASSDAAGLIGLLPVISMRRAYNIPLPALVGAEPYGTLCTPLLDRDTAEDAAAKLLRQARLSGAHALILPNMSLEGPAMQAITAVLQRDGLHLRVLKSSVRAALDATRDADELLRDALGAKKLKELRRLRNRLAGHGAVHFEVARSTQEVAAALEVFLKLEASGWKGQRGTALVQDAGDAAFARRAAVALAESGRCEIVTLRAGDTPIAAAIVVRHQHRAFYFKLGIDERFAKYSPGVQLTLELTRHLCADPAITSADSTASPDHPMIDPIWRGRFAIGDVLIPLRKNDPVVPLIHAALVARRFMLEQGRRAVRSFRKRH
jgi:CelD/BcsL family acetyltransferase involved in cellulose biosynthesis